MAAAKLDGVESVEVSLKRAVADIRLREGNTLTLERLRKTIRDNGFTPREAVVTAVGKVIERGGKPAFEVSGIDTVLVVAPERTAPEALKQLRETGRAGAASLVELIGTVETKGDGPDQIAVTGYKGKPAP